MLLSKNTFCSIMYRSLSPSWYQAEGIADFAFFLGEYGLNEEYLDGGVAGNGCNHNIFSRPSVVLLKNITILEGIGTKDNPYVIN